ncbi:restriction endonuclease [bacterium]|nr:restriction endonuclease [FCB group bacterium]MBL7190475.1 restriction endonuclease [bacterium]
MENKLYYGDNLKIMRESIEDESVDLVYLDPPFNSSATYNILFKDESGDFAPSQIKAFSDTWRWPDAVEEFDELRADAPENVRRMIEGFYDFLGPCAMMAYLVMMSLRILELRRVLKATGSLYLHCDPTASHYLKILMDSVFDVKNFRNEITWCYKERELSKRYWNKKHDVILFYVKDCNKSYTFNWSTATYEYSPGTFAKFQLTDEDGRKYQIRGKGGPYTGKHGLSSQVEKEHPEWIYRDYLDDKPGVLPRDWWIDIPFLNRAARERLGYPTQKPQVLLERIIKASSNEGDVVLDPFCGCGTTIEAAEKLKRKWIGIDITHLSIQLVRKRIDEAFEGECIYAVHGIPEDYGSAKELAKQDKYEFQWWALSLVDARPFGGEDYKKKGRDRGIDGIYSFIDDEKRKSKIAVISVKGGTTGPVHVRELKGTVEREKAAIGILITLDPPTNEMKLEASTAGFYESYLFKKKFPKIQIISVKEYFNDNLRAELPNFSGRSIAFKKAQKVVKEDGENQNDLQL